MFGASGSLGSWTRGCSIGRPPGAPGLSRRFPTSSRSVAPTRLPSSSAAASAAGHRRGFTPRSSTAAPKRRSRSTSAPRRSSSTSNRDARSEPKPTINDTRDFGVGRLLTDANWQALIDVGHQINQLLLDHQLDACACAPDAMLLDGVVPPSTTYYGLPAPRRRFGEPRTMALLACLCSFQHLFAGLTNRTLRVLIAASIPPYGPRQMTYDLRRLRRKGFIQRIPHTQRNVTELTSEGRRLLAVFLHQDLHPHRQPVPRRTRPRTPRTRSPPHHHLPPRGARSNAESRTKSDRPLSRPER